MKKTKKVKKYSKSELKLMKKKTAEKKYLTYGEYYDLTQGFTKELK